MELPVPERLTPGIFVEEAPRGEQSIASQVVTVAAFVGRTVRGPVDEPVLIESIDEFHRIFGGPWEGSTLGPSAGNSTSPALASSSPPSEL